MLYSKSHKALGTYFRSIRVKRGLTQKYVGDHLGYSAQFVYNFEKQKSPMPLEAIKKMIRLYKLDPKKVISMILKKEREFLKEKLM